ncbi:NAD(P)/FAD-dependent oxidoreductase [Pedobacter mucosus]|uniref:NAD(P)/FAD-dependent oxidoreductase n=1 Tax=Pedobacter mucosus TaxID=2895286 RepID=UPI001EE414FE|nr:NAD(P)/FAD-dependent oxidoreductase [Pedobacter mucosus]UKT62601.1 NAD(P)/FAD-dependent oxidoreductase [Pedobacter mucosus]
MKKVVIAGGGFAGLNLAKKLSSAGLFEVVLIDKNNYHFFPPLLYQVSTAFIESSNITYPFRKMFHNKKNLTFYMGSILNVKTDQKIIETDSGSLSYDFLILAMGTETNFFGNENVKSNALPMKNIDDALQLRNHILLQLEKAVRVTSLAEKELYANIVIAGGGPTGVEIAGMLAEMAHNIVAKDYPEATSGVGNIYLVDGGKALLGPMSTKSQAEALHVLENLGVKVKLNTLVKDYVNNTVFLGDGTTIPAATLVWASGVIAKEVVGLPAEVITRGRRILVDEFNLVKGSENIFAIGDQCLMTSDVKFPNGHPQLAQVAIQQGKWLAENLIHQVEGKPMKAFTYNDKGSMAIIAKFKAVVDLPKGFFKGFFAWLVWLFIHIIPIAGFRNKVKLAFNWLWSFLTNDPTLRLIIRPNSKNKAA